MTPDHATLRRITRAFAELHDRVDALITLDGQNDSARNDLAAAAQAYEASFQAVLDAGRELVRQRQAFARRLSVGVRVDSAELAERLGEK
jgi:hypothetical protein